jgi:UDP-N-acetyl-D-mannosaminuronic acid dehydrogenase
MTEAGADVRVHDPWVEDYPGVEVEKDLDVAVNKADAIAIFTGHSQYRTLDSVQLKKLSGEVHPIIIDGRNVVDPDAFIGIGFVYKGIGRGDKNEHPLR